MEEHLYQFLNDRKTELSEASRRAYRYKILHFVREMEQVGGKCLKSLTKELIAEYISMLIDQDHKPATISNMLHILKSFARWLWEKDVLGEKEYKKIRAYRPKLLIGEDNRRALTPQEEKQCRKEITNPLHRMMFFVGTTYGLRTQEHANLEVQDVDLKKKHLAIRASKGNKTRYIPILPAHIKEWRNWLMVRKAYSLKHDYVFFTSRGQCSTKSVQNFFRLMSRTVFGENKDKWFTPHILRYTYATKLWRGGMDLYDISKVLGHASIETTQRYLRVREEELRDRYLAKAAAIL